MNKLEQQQEDEILLVVQELARCDGRRPSLDRLRELYRTTVLPQFEDVGRPLRKVSVRDCAEHIIQNEDALVAEARERALALGVTGAELAESVDVARAALIKSALVFEGSQPFLRRVK